LVVNWAAGLTQDTITLDEIYEVIETVSPFLHTLIREVIEPS
jgi:purine nucleoside phosphorylase